MTENSSEIWAQEEYRFHGQRPDEQVMLLRNQHPMVLLKLFIWVVISLVLPYLCARLFPGLFSKFLIGYLVIVIFILAYRIYGYRSSISILTNQRILNVKQHGFFNCEISEAELDRIQDVSSATKGVWQTLFHFGDVTIRTASKDSLLVLANISTPYDFQQAIVRSLKDVKRAAE